MQKIKILHIIKSLGRGGAEMLLPETLKLHDKNKFDFRYIYFLPWKNQMVEYIENSGGIVIPFTANNNLQLLSKANAIMTYCKQEKIDLIHCHLPWAGFLGRILYLKLNIPVIYTEHNIQEKYHPVTKILNKYSYNHQSLALGVSEDVTRSIVENINPNIRVKTLLNGVNTEQFQRDQFKGVQVRKKYGIPEKSVVIGNVAVFREQKGISDWIRAFKKISERIPNVYGLLVGAGPKEEEIKSLIMEMGLGERVILPGLQTDTISYFSAMDIFMMSSLFEGLPIALLEAMSMECAVTSTKAGGVVEVISSETDGLLCEVGDWENLALLTEQLVLDENERIKYQMAARKRVENSFSLKKMVESLEGIYVEEIGFNKELN